MVTVEILYFLLHGLVITLLPRYQVPEKVRVLINFDIKIIYSLEKK